MQGKTISGKLFTNFHLSERISQGNFYRRLKGNLPLHWLYKRQKNISEANPVLLV